MERQRQSIPIQGINRAESDDTVKDGACEDIYNFRYRAGVFENVRQPLLLHPITQSDGFSIVHRLDAMDQGEYLAEKEGALWRVKIADGTVTGLEQITVLPGDVADTRYFHFGNVLYVNFTLGGVLKELVFRYKDGSFNNLNFGMLEPPAMQISCEYKSASKVEAGMTSGDEFSFSSLGFPEGVYLAHFHTESNAPANNTKTFYYNTGIEPLTEKGYITGTAYVFAAYKLFDGSIIKQSMIDIITADSYDGDQFLYRHQVIKRGVNTTTDNYYYGRRGVVKPTITVDVPDTVINNSLIESVVIYCTRNVDTYNYDAVNEKYGTGDYPIHNMLSKNRADETLKYCSHNCMWNEDLDGITGPFYEVADIDFRAGENSVTLTYDKHFKNIEHFPVYESNYSCHNTISESKYDYNDRLHIYDLRTKLFSGFNPFITTTDPLGDETNSQVPPLKCAADWTIVMDGKEQIVRSESMVYSKQHENGLTISVRNPISYPDSRAKNLTVWAGNTGGLPDGYAYKERKVARSSEVNMTFYMEKDGAINTATFYISGNEPLAKREFTLENNCILRTREIILQYGHTPVSTDQVNKLIVSRNKLQVSYPSNPFVYAPSNIYTVGGQGERIREIIATAERMTEVAYGYQPLLVFTNRATYALESGEGEVLYARNIPILSQSIVEGTNAVEGNGAVFFVSTSGVTAIVRGQISNISEPMRRWAGLIASDATLPDFEKYTRDARLLFNRNESELIVYNPSYSYAYVYSLLGKYWTRREWDASVEPCFGEIVTADGVTSLFEEDPERPASSCKLVTRPLKFGSLEYTRLEKLAARIRWGESSRFILSIEGSDDAMRWVPLRAESNQPSIRRTSSSFRYHRVQLTGSVADCLAITHFDVEFYNKFVHRLR